MLDARTYSNSPRVYALRLGMPHLGMHNLSESALLKSLGSDRWEHLQDLTGVPSAKIVDDSGARLYPTFFFVELSLSPERPLAAYGENQTIEFVADLGHFGKTHLDGCYRWRGSSDWLRMSNVFIHQRHGPSKLAVAFPANVDFTTIPELAEAPSSLTRCREARNRKQFLEPLPDDRLLLEAETVLDHDLDPDRDLNGAGLVYFANFISFLDRAERQLLSGLADPVPLAVINSRSTYRRMIGYYGNADSGDRLSISCTARMRVVERGPGDGLVDFSFDFVVRRVSDQREIVVSSCRKVASVAEPSARLWLERQDG